MLTITPAPDKTCAICLGEKQIVQATFADKSFNSPVCLKDLWKMIDARTKNKQSGKPSKPEARPETKPEAKSD